MEMVVSICKAYDSEIASTHWFFFHMGEIDIRLQLHTYSYLEVELICISV